jgi:tripartite-type tricarboxylate transporter receptor subunit TctC
MNLTKLERLSGAHFTMIPFAGFGEMGPALLGGHVESIIALPGEVKPHVDAGKMRLLGMFQPNSGGDRLKAVLWEDYREHTTALGALGLLKK